jgi:NADPH:quinone reductase-like Zn-dependent oxidoreductase
VLKIQVAEFGSAEVMQMVQVDLPGPAANQVQIRVYAAGVNPADTYIRSGTYAFQRPELPYTPGFDAAGTVQAVGDDVTTHHVGDRVFVAGILAAHTGAYAEVIVCDSDAVHPLPDHLTFQQGAAIGVPWVTAYRALFQRGQLQPGETVLIHGASGGVGLPAVQMASRFGAIVVGTAGTSAGATLVRNLGARTALNHSQEGYLDQIDEITGGRGVDLVVEMLADRNLEKDFGALAKGGRIVIVGSRGTLTFTPRLSMIKEADIRGTALWNMTAAEYAEATAAVAGYLASNEVSPTVGAVFKLSEAAKAHEYVLSGHAHGKCVLDCE